MYTFALFDDLQKETPLIIRDYIIAPERIIPFDTINNFLAKYYSIPSDPFELLKYISKPHPVWIPVLTIDKDKYTIFRKFPVIDGHALRALREAH
jgi:hypothetical protein